ncbi:zinc finger and BTB domain-containing protein 49-like [Diabrotica virgifera virgifera]|uniref:Zinc finger and BTB domain-containing protein 49-like n=1 Tax=Diabrotica virgifera virgifera TaxID=50390 RepID=A0A6P7FLW9_DIAVI|nr:zinc finger and BTB domain-containing protein 49-like [Diabrotica virgifera virgifera]
MEEICRSCLKQTPKKYTLTGKLINLEVTIADMLEYCTSNKLDLSQELPRHICTFCFRTVRMAYEFFKQFIDSQNKLYLLKSSEKAVNPVKKVFHFHSYTEANKCDQLVSIDERENQSEKYANTDNETQFEKGREYETVVVKEVNINEIEVIQSTVDEIQNNEKNESLQTYICDSDFINVTNDSHNKIVTEEEILIEEDTYILDSQQEIEHADFADILETDIENTDLYEECELDSNLEPRSSDVELSVIIKNHENKNEKLYPFICPICALKFSRVDMFAKHILQHKQKIIICSRCEAKPEYELEEYIEHYKEFHKLQCEICNKKMTSYFGYSYHMKQHINNSCYKCPIKDCQRSFVLRGLLRKHVKNHYEPQVFKCDLCASKFNNRDTLRYHVKKHLNKKDHLCTICGRTFYLAGHLTHHMNSHLGNKRYACSICEKRFITSTCLKRHVAVCSKKHSFAVTDYGMEEVVEND